VASELTIYTRTKLNAAQSPLLRLPAEIRNAIYTYVFSDQIYEYKASCSDALSITCRAEYPCLGLLLASRQVQHETALLPYKLATFLFEIRNPCDPLEPYTFVEKRSKAQLTVLGHMEVMYGKKRWHGTGHDFERCYDYDLPLCGEPWEDWFDAPLCE